MTRSLRLIAVAAIALFLNGCADDLSPEIKDRPPAPYSPDPTNVIPQQETRGSGTTHI